MEKTGELNSLIINSGLPQNKTVEIAENLSSFFIKASEWQDKINDIVITDPKQVREMKLARESRLMLRSYRLEAEKLIKEKREILKEKMSDDILFDKLLLNANKMIKATFENLETKLHEKEKFAERWEAEERQKLIDKRTAELNGLNLVYDYNSYMLDKISEDEFQRLKKRLIQEKEENETKQELKRRQSEMLNAGFLWNGSKFVFMTIEITPDNLKTMTTDEFDTAINEAKEMILEINKHSVTEKKPEPVPEPATVIDNKPTQQPTTQTAKSVKLDFLNYIDSLKIELPFGALEVEDEINEKFNGFKNWAKKLILTNLK